MTKYKLHPLATIFPEMQKEEFEQLKADISKRGLDLPITLCRENEEDYILDGRHRMKACAELGITPRYEYFEGPGTLAEFVLGRNLNRRHLSVSEKAMVAARIAEDPNYGLRAAAEASHKEGSSRGGSSSQGFDKIVKALKPDNPPKLDVAAQVADMVGVSRGSVVAALAVQKHGTKEDIAEVDSGRVTVSRKSKEIRERRREKGELKRRSPKTKDSAKKSFRTGKTIPRVESKPWPESRESAIWEQAHKFASDLATVELVNGGMDLDKFPDLKTLAAFSECLKGIERRLPGIIKNIDSYYENQVHENKKRQAMKA